MMVLGLADMFKDLMMRKLLLILATIIFTLTVDAPTSQIGTSLMSTVGTSYAEGGAMMCGRKIIHAGDSKHLLISRFGEPESREFVGMVHRGDACVKMEEWLYICRKHLKPKMYVIRIVGTTIVSIEWLPDVQ